MAVAKQHTVDIFGNELNLKTHFCAFDDTGFKEVEKPYINLYVRTKFCNARCPFCIYHSDASKWNNDKFIEVLEEINKKIPIGKFSITGGEPTLYWDTYKLICDTAKQYIPECDWQITTDGFRWQQLWQDEGYKDMKYIHLSRHHYDDDRNNEIFKTKTPTTEEIKAVTHKKIHPHQISLRCNLMHDGINSVEEVFKYLDWANECGINEVGLVTLMPINEFSKDNYIKFHIKDLICDNFMFTKSQNRFGGGCECFNYLYRPEKNYRAPIRVYHKNTFNPSALVGTTEILVFDGENLRIGFDGKILY